HHVRNHKLLSYHDLQQKNQHGAQIVPPLAGWFFVDFLPFFPQPSAGSRYFFRGGEAARLFRFFYPSYPRNPWRDAYSNPHTFAVFRPKILARSSAEKNGMCV